MNFIDLKLPDDSTVKELDFKTKLLYARLYDKQLENKNGYFEYSDSLAFKELNMKRGSVHRALTTLSKKGLITIELKFSSQGFNIRTLKVKCWDQVDPCWDQDDPRKDQDDPRWDQHRSGWDQRGSGWDQVDPNINNINNNNINNKLNNININTINNMESKQKLKTKVTLPKSVDEVVILFEEYKQKNIEKYPELEHLDVEEQANMFWLYWNEQQNWKDSKGKPVKSIALRIATWCKNCRDKIKSTTTPNKHIETDEERAKRLEQEFFSGNIFGMPCEKQEVETECEVVGSDDLSLLED